MKNVLGRKVLCIFLFVLMLIVQISSNTPTVFASEKDEFCNLDPKNLRIMDMIPMIRMGNT